MIDGTECQIHLDKEASMSFVSKHIYLECSSLYSLPKFAPETRNNIIPVIVNIHGHR